MSRRLVWTPLSPAELSPTPAGLRVEQVDPGVTGAESPALADIADVEFYVPAYDTPVDLATVLPAMTSLRVLQTQTAGVDAVQRHRSEQVTLCNARGVHDASTAELAVTLLLASLRGIPDFVRAQDDGRWAYAYRRALADHTVLLVGHGSIGVALERRLAPFECHLLRVARTARQTSDGQQVHGLGDLPALLPQADAVVLLVPLTEDTRGLAGSDFLAAMRDQAVLVNVSRGPVVDMQALVRETTSGRLQAALDVTDPEPLPPDHPLWHAPGVLISPHVGGATTAMSPRLRALLRDQLDRFAAGEQLANVVAGPLTQPLR
ncbi:MAG: 2-hydroxyacid dehydrogenase [Actinomycetota bacterium]|nr:2-hydroxyacid dehydrogenase [Actinomycetota bacterium]